MAGDSAYDLLRGKIVTGELAPNQHLVEQELAERHGLTRATVRVALVRLEQDGLVVRERHRGARVRLVSQREAFEILEARAALESIAARHAALRATRTEIAELRRITAEMEDLLRAGDLLAISDRNARLHRRILELSGHQTVQRLTAMLQSQLVRFQYRTILAPGRPERSLAEHRAILEAIAAHDGEVAADAMRVHLSHVAETLRQRVEVPR
ncbi:MAG: GntR family transcriptional regulator [Carbonactinosporaceae bacterium]